MPLTEDQKERIKNHSSHVTLYLSVFSSALNLDELDNDRYKNFLIEILDQCKDWIKVLKDIVQE